MATIAGLQAQREVSYATHDRSVTGTCHRQLTSRDNLLVFFVYIEGYVMKIRHVLPGDNLVACYIMNKEPYGVLKTVLHKALVTDEGEDKIVGFILDDVIKAATDIDKTHTRFMGYKQANEFTKDQWEIYRDQLVNWGRKWASESQPVPDQVRKMWAENAEVPEGVG